MSTIFASPMQVTEPAECSFYHSMQIPGFGPVVGEWDLRCDTAGLLGHIDWRGKRVLEIGPASGFLSFWMEQQGAEVVAVDLPDDPPGIYLPRDDADPVQVGRERREHIQRMKRSFWFAHRAFGSRVRVYYGDALRLPQELGRFDVALVANTLVHCRDPMGILAACSRLTDGTVVVVEAEYFKADGPIMYFVPTDENRAVDTWWFFSPAVFVNALGALGFRHSRVSYSSAWCEPTKADRKMFTVVASRTAQP